MIYGPHLRIQLEAAIARAEAAERELQQDMYELGEMRDRLVNERDSLRLDRDAWKNTADIFERERDAACLRGRTDERNDVVEWLLTDGRDESGDDAGKAIERGVHQTCRMRAKP